MKRETETKSKRHSFGVERCSLLLAWLLKLLFVRFARTVSETLSVRSIIDFVDGGIYVFLRCHQEK